MSAVGVYSAALRRAARGDAATLRLISADGRHTRRLDPAAWCAKPSAGDASVVTRCTGATLDVGCGPGRLTAELAARGVPALGIDIAPAALRLATARGATVLARSVFDPLPSEGRWGHALLIDGNLGIGGDPVRLLRRCRDLVRPGGTVLTEVEPPGTPTWQGDVAISDDSRTSELFSWSIVGLDRIEGLAHDAGLRILDVWTKERRWFASLQR
jgi:SAM-dependent methyltransferase